MSPSCQKCHFVVSPCHFLPYRFTAKELDEETGLYYYGARYLDPKYSRWLSTDPALGEYIPKAPINEEAKRYNQNLPGMGGIFNTVNGNLYHYAGNNPVKYIDPDGQNTWERKLFEFWVESTLDGNPPTQTQMLNDIINCSNQQFAFTFEKIQQNLNKGIVAGIRFISDYGSEISLICYATGNVQLALIIDGISFACDVSLAIYDYQNSEKNNKDKIKLGADLTTTAISTFTLGKIGETATKRFKKIGQEEFNKKLTNMISNIIETEFDKCIDEFLEGVIE